MNKKNVLIDYWPLISLILIAVSVASALSFSIQSDMTAWMHYFMGFFLAVFAMLKIFNIPGFADGFCKYDLLAKKFKPYAYIYPFIELALSLGYFSFYNPHLVYPATIVVMMFGAVGVLIALKSGLKVNCSCMGTVLNVPLSTVTLTEDIGMILMAVLLIFFR